MSRMEATKCCIVESCAQLALSSYSPPCALPPRAPPATHPPTRHELVQPPLAQLLVLPPHLVGAESGRQHGCGLGTIDGRHHCAQ